MATSGSQAAVAYPEVLNDPVRNMTIKLQRLNSLGVAEGAVIDVVTGQGDDVALTSDSLRYWICWTDNDDTNVSCATVLAATGEVTMGATVTGNAPSLASGTAGVVLFMVNTSGVIAQRLDDTASANGAPVTIAGSDAI